MLECSYRPTIICTNVYTLILVVTSNKYSTLCMHKSLCIYIHTYTCTNPALLYTPNHLIRHNFPVPIYVHNIQVLMNIQLIYQIRQSAICFEKNYDKLTSYCSIHCMSCQFTIYLPHTSPPRMHIVLPCVNELLWYVALLWRLITSQINGQVLWDMQVRASLVVIGILN